MTELPAAFFRQLSENTFEPSEATIGPWSPDFQHGGPPCALLTHALRTYPSQAPFVITRITVELLSAVPVTPCEIKVEIVRSGKRIELLRGEYLSGGKMFLIAHAWRFSPAPGITTPVLEAFETPPFTEAQSHTFFPGSIISPTEKPSNGVSARGAMTLTDRLWYGRDRGYRWWKTG